MRDNFTASLTAVLKSEGGNDDDPDDHGGRTSRGITQREYDAWRKEHGEPQIDVWTAPEDDIEEIYHDEYWQPWCDSMELGLDYMFFDMSVLAGPYRATVLLQMALDVAPDGRIGPITRAAIASADIKALIPKYTDEKMRFFKGLNQPKFTKGWVSRANEVQATALKMFQSEKAA